MRYLLLLIILIFSCKKDAVKQIEVVNKLNFKNAKTGDVFLSYGKSFLSEMIVQSLNEKVAISHCGIVIKTNKQVYICHYDIPTDSNKEGISIVPIEKIITESHSFYIVRAIDKIEDSAKLVNFIAKNIKQKKGFDYTFDYTDKSKIFCSEFIRDYFLEVYKAEKFNTKNKVLYFNDLLDTTKFKIIYKKKDEN